MTLQTWAKKYVEDEWDDLIGSVYFGYETNPSALREALAEAYQHGVSDGRGEAR